jgi:hypothetical protein
MTKSRRKNDKRYGRGEELVHKITPSALKQNFENYRLSIHILTKTGWKRQSLETIMETK